MPLLSVLKQDLLTRGFTNDPGLIFMRLLNPIINPVTIRTILSLVISYSWAICQPDVNNAFLNGHLIEVYMSQPHGLCDPIFPTHVCRLQKTI